MKRRRLLFSIIIAIGNLINTGCDQNNHEYNELWSSDAKHHWHECTTHADCGTVLDYAEHEVSDWIVDQEPTCDTVGSKHKECTICSRKMGSVNIDATGHTYGVVTYEWSSDYTTCTAKRMCSIDSYEDYEVATTTAVITRQATCVLKEEITYSATFTNESYKTQTKEVVTPTSFSHTPGEWTQKKAATCQSMGTKETTCTVCGETYTANTSQLNHNYIKIYDPSADYSTCTATDYCTMCKSIRNQQTAELYNSFISMEANCNTEEQTTYVFHFDTPFESEVTFNKITGPKLNHQFEDGVCTLCGEMNDSYIVSLTCLHDVDGETDEVTTYYETLQEAIDAIPENNDGTYTYNIYVSDNIEEDGFEISGNKHNIYITLGEFAYNVKGEHPIRINVNDDCEIYFDGGTITNDASNTFENLIEVCGVDTNSYLCLFDTTIDCSANSNCNAVIYCNGANIEMSGASLIAADNNYSIVVDVFGIIDSLTEKLVPTKMNQFFIHDSILNGKMYIATDSNTLSLQNSMYSTNRENNAFANLNIKMFSEMNFENFEFVLMEGINPLWLGENLYLDEIPFTTNPTTLFASIIDSVYTVNYDESNGSWTMVRI